MNFYQAPTIHHQCCRHLGKTIDEQRYFKNPCLCGTYIFVDAEYQLWKVMNLSTMRPWAADQTHLRLFHQFYLYLLRLLWKQIKQAQ